MNLIKGIIVFITLQVKNKNKNKTKYSQLMLQKMFIRIKI